MLHWLDGSPKQYKTFVGNRVASVLEVLPAHTWRHVPTDERLTQRTAPREVLPPENSSHTPSGGKDLPRLPRSPSTCLHSCYLLQLSTQGRKSSIIQLSLFQTLLSGSRIVIATMTNSFGSWFGSGDSPPT